jgi:DNA-binding transcriptional MocR family regulator
MIKNKPKGGKSQTFYNKSYAVIPPELLASQAFLTITSAKTLIILIRFYQKIYRKKQKKKKGIKGMVMENNGQIIFTYAEAAELGISAATFWKAVKELLARGFIDIAGSGNWYEKEPNRFSISRRYLNYGKPDFQVVKWERNLPDGLGFQKKRTKDALVSESEQALVSESQRPVLTESQTLEYKSQKKRRTVGANL